MNIKKIKNIINSEKNIYREKYRGFEYWIVRVGFMSPQKPIFTHLCGYVVIDRKSKFYISDDYHDYPINCHGGLTFANKIDSLSIPFCIGFDCNHSQDISVLDHDLIFENAEYRNVKYVRKECRSIINQLTTYDK